MLRHASTRTGCKYLDLPLSGNVGVQRAGARGLPLSNRPIRLLRCNPWFCAFNVVTIVNSDLRKASSKIAVDWQGQHNSGQRFIVMKQHVDESEQSIRQPSLPESSLSKWLVVYQVFKVCDTEFRSPCERAKWRDRTHVSCANVNRAAVIKQSKCRSRSDR